MLRRCDGIASEPAAWIILAAILAGMVCGMANDGDATGDIDDGGNDAAADDDEGDDDEKEGDDDDDDGGEHRFIP